MIHCTRSYFVCPKPAYSVCMKPACDRFHVSDRFRVIGWHYLELSRRIAPKHYSSTYLKPVTNRFEAYRVINNKRETFSPSPSTYAKPVTGRFCAYTVKITCAGLDFRFLHATMQKRLKLYLPEVFLVEGIVVSDLKKLSAPHWGV